MRIGTTPKHEFILPISTDQVERVEITYSQYDKIVLQKYESDCSMEGNVVSVRLTQAETFLFDHVPRVNALGLTTNNISVQIRFLTTGDDVHASDVFLISPEECLAEEEM